MSAPEQVADLYDTEFDYYLSLSKGLIENLKDRQDRRICVNWIRKLCRLENSDVHVKSSRNSFFKYLLQTLKMVQSPKWLDSQLCKEAQHERRRSKSQEAVISHWSKDKRTYIAVKPLPGQGALIYMAVAKDPKMGWDSVEKK